jgi:hypothetical protein
MRLRVWLESGRTISYEKLDSGVWRMIVADAEGVIITETDADATMGTLFDSFSVMFEEASG